MYSISYAMHLGALVIRKLRWGLLSKSLGIIIDMKDDFVTVLWSDSGRTQQHYPESLEMVEDQDRNYRQRTCTLA